MSLSGRHNNRKSLRATNIELHSRDISVVSNDTKIYTTDYDNLYNLRMDKVINNSPTAKRCANMMKKYIVGNGIAEGGDIIVNTKGETLNDISDLAAIEISYQYGVYFFISWTIDVDYDNLKPKFVKTNLKVLDSIPMVKSKEDDDGFPGKFYQLDFIEKKGVYKNVDENTKWFYPYNENPKVILQQMKNDCKLKGIIEPTPQQLVYNYRGQVDYLNLTPKYIYALPPWDSVYDDMDTEYRISKYNNNQARRGWLGKVFIKKYDGGDEENEKFNQELKNNIGSENADSIMVIDVPEGSTDDLSKAFSVEQVKPQFDDKLFEGTKKTLRQNITGNFNNIPEPLVYSGSGALFGTSAETYSEMKRFYWEQNEYERFKLEKRLSKLTGIPINYLPVKGVE
ncbi:hypothetical protein [Elizabethkingia ursingii]|uniref:hypothetical protein n=1 Tax=Elizabethkingia ursingii TaxID=1756150 RepID=UPI0007514AD4|nr:hypothetical protein [Elizabethkingia ursingii]KUY29391.1 hypothetical protein ATB96_18925 [Elizabethkingia ursingii]